jgi:hypothetical protein
VSAERRVLIIANRTATTPMLLDEVRRRAARGHCAFALVIPFVGRREDGEWSLAGAMALLEEVAGSPVEVVGSGREALKEVECRFRRGDFDDVIVSTWPRRTSLWPLRTRRDGGHRFPAPS